MKALLTILGTEKSRYVLAEALHGLRQMPKPEETDLRPICEYLEDRDSLKRQGAVLALEHSRSSEAERRVLDLLATTSYDRDRFYCVAVLMSIGTAAALPALRQELASARKDIRFAANEAIELIAERRMRT